MSNSDPIAAEVLVTVEVSAQLHAFLSGLSSAAAQDIAQGLKRLVSQVVGAKRKTASSPQVLVLQDAVIRLQVVRRCV